MILITSAFTLLSASAKVQDEINQVYDFSANGEINLSNINGDVRISACDCSQVTLRAQIMASNQELRDRISVEIDANESRLDVKTRYEKSSKHNYGQSRVDYTLTVPNTVNLDDIELVNGNLTISGVSGKLGAELVNGHLDSDGSSSDIDVDAVNGDIDIRVENFAHLKRIELNSVNGAIKLRLPNADDISLDASSVNGSLSNEFGIPVKKHKWVGSSMKSTQRGSVDIELETVNGSIRVVEN